MSLGRLHPPEGVSLNGTRSPALTFQVGCKLSLMFFQYCIMANFYWLLVEGLFLHTLLVASFSPRCCFQAYLLIGWGKALPTTNCLPACPAPFSRPEVPAASRETLCCLKRCHSGHLRKSSARTVRPCSQHFSREPGRSGRPHPIAE